VRQNGFCVRVVLGDAQVGALPRDFEIARPLMYGQDGLDVEVTQRFRVFCMLPIAEVEFAWD
jgi:hypothetical protein